MLGKSAIKAYQSGKTQAEIAIHLGVAQRTIGRWLALAGIKARPPGWNGSKRYSHNPNAWSKATPDAAYFAGLMMADGWLNGNILCIELVNRDKHILNELKKFLAYTGKLERRANRRMSMLRVSSKRLVSDLIKWGVVHRKSKRGRISASITRSPIAKFYFRGLFDGDGCLHRRKSGYLYLNFCGNRHIVQEFRNWAKKVIGSSGSLVRRHRIDVAQFFCKNAELLAMALYGDPRAPRLRRKERIWLTKC